MFFEPIVRIRDEDFGYCEPVPDPWNDPDCMLTEVSTVFEHEDGNSSRLPNESFGYATGFGLTTRDAMFDKQCNEPYPYRRAYMTRLGCDNDCPPPTVIEACEGNPLPTPHDDGRVSLQFWDYPYSTWEFECRVLEVTMQVMPGDVTEVETTLDCLGAG
jgi:hypothetical protein